MNIKGIGMVAARIQACRSKSAQGDRQFVRTSPTSGLRLLRAACPADLDPYQNSLEEW